MIHETLRLRGQGLMLNVHRFAPPQLAADAGTVLLLHGFMDAGGTWSAVAEELTRHGLQVVAPDFRGFGRSDRVPAGGYYHFADYVADTAAIVNELAPAELTVVGHSMGGTVACYYAGAVGARVDRLVLMEGVGPPDMTPDLGPTRMRTWLKQLASPKARSRLGSHDEAVSRLAANHPRVDRETLERVAWHLTTAGEDGAFAWAFDPLHRTTSPSIFRVDGLGAFLREIRVPVLFMGGGKSGWHPPDEAARLEMLAGPVEKVELEGAGHMLHWTQPTWVGETIAAFIAKTAAAGGPDTHVV